MKTSKLWLHMAEVHGITLLETEEFDIVSAVDSDWVDQLQDRNITIREQDAEIDALKAKVRELEAREETKP